MVEFSFWCAVRPESDLAKSMETYKILSGYLF